MQGPGSATVGFEVGAYDTKRPLVIDPVLVYSTYLGGSGDDSANSITVDSAGNAYVIGYTDSTNFPLAGAMQTTYGGNPQDIFVSKLNPAGTALVYSTYIGGSGQDNGSDIAVDVAGNAYITGFTGSTNFPTANALQPGRTGLFNAFVAKLDPTGSQLIYSTYFGGTVGEQGSCIAVDAAGNAYVAGVASSPDFPKLNAFQSQYGGDLADGFVTKFSPDGGQILYSTYLGGSGNDGVTGIAVDTTGNAYVTGVTYSTNFPTANPVQGTYRGGSFDAFVTKLNPTGSAGLLDLSRRLGRGSRLSYRRRWLRERLFSGSHFVGGLPYNRSVAANFRRRQRCFCKQIRPIGGGNVFHLSRRQRRRWSNGNRYKPGWRCLPDRFHQLHELPAGRTVSGNLRRRSV